MWSKGIRWLLLIQLQFSNRSNLIIPIPLISLYEIIDELDTFIKFIKFFRIPIRIKINDNIKIYGAPMLSACLTILNGIKYMEPVDLVNVNTKDVKVRIRIL